MQCVQLNLFYTVCNYSKLNSECARRRHFLSAKYSSERRPCTIGWDVQEGSMSGGSGQVRQAGNSVGPVFSDCGDSIVVLLRARISLHKCVVLFKFRTDHRAVSLMMKRGLFGINSSKIIFESRERWSEWQKLCQSNVQPLYHSKRFYQSNFVANIFCIRVSAAEYYSYCFINHQSLIRLLQSLITTDYDRRPMPPGGSTRKAAIRWSVGTLGERRRVPTFRPNPSLLDDPPDYPELRKVQFLLLNPCLKIVFLSQYASNIIIAGILILANINILLVHRYNTMRSPDLS